MRPTLSRSIAAIRGIALGIALVGAGILIEPLQAARRPSYGGTLRIETAESMQSIEPGEPKLAGLVFETLVRLDDRGRAQPWLALAWTHDPARKRWTFTPRPNVTLHNGARWEPSEASLSFPDDRPIQRILADLARPRNAIAIHTADGTVVGTGPFAVTRWEAGKSVTLTSHAAYWGGRPYLDSIEIAMGQTLRQQALDLELGKADAIEVDITALRRLRQQNANLAVSAPMDALVLVFDGPRAIAPPVPEALALSIDRSAIQTVLLQRQGEVSAALLPQWLSGYSFVFPAARDLARARQLGAGAPMLTVGYERGDALARAIAERIAVNASEAAIAVRATPDGPANAHVVRLRITSPDPRTALEDLAEQLLADQVKVQPPAAADSLYDAERALLDGSRIIPLVHVPMAWQLSPKVHAWSTAWRLEDTWLEP
jgi:peptide/nickel transport system substrate-binding protein